MWVFGAGQSPWACECSKRLPERWYLRPPGVGPGFPLQFVIRLWPPDRALWRCCIDFGSTIIDDAGSSESCSFPRKTP